MTRSIGDERETPAWIALGSNLGDRDAWLAFGRAAMAAAPGVRVVATTAPEDTAPLGGLDQPHYLNQMLRVMTVLTPDALLAMCHDVERRAGRRRRERWASRTLDLDIVRFGDVVCDRPGLTLPHPGLRDRDFWQREMAELESRD